MRTLAWILAATSLVSVAVGVACSSESVQPADAGGNDAGPDVTQSPPPPPDSGNDAGPAFGISFKISAFDFYATDQLEGAEVCVLDHPEVVCQLTTALGTATLNNVPEAELTLGLRKAGYASGAYPVDTQRPLGSALRLPLLKAADIQSRLADGGVFDVAAANIATTDINSNDPGLYTVAIVPASGTPETIGSLIGVVGVTPGPFELTATGLPDSGTTCANKGALAWSVDGGAQARAKAYAGYVTGIYIVCN